MFEWLKSLLSALLKQPPAIAEPTASPPVHDDADYSSKQSEMRAWVIAAGCEPSAAQAVAIAFVAAFQRFGIVSHLVIAHVLAHCAHESGNFTKLREDLSYRSAARIREVFGGNRGIAALSNTEVEGLVRNPEALANIVYADANRSAPYKLGNWMPGDGYLCRGWGWPQLTGRDALEAFARYIGISFAEILQRTDADINALAALWFGTVYKKGFIAAAMADDLVRTTEIWNGGRNGFADRAEKLISIKRSMGTTQ